VDVLARGTVVAGKYRVEHKLGIGGMGEVYLATHDVLGIRVAIKVLLPVVVRDKQIVARFLQEARAAARIEGEHIARVSDVGTLPDGTPFMVMELLEGEDLGELLAHQGVLAPPLAVAYLLEAMVGVGEAHERGFVHRDLKPSNLFVVRKKGKRDRVKVLDFGISKNGLDGAPQITTTGVTLGSPAYMSPEQVKNTKAVDVRADVWSLGVIAYELMTGQLPFPGETTGAVLAAVLSEDPAPPHEVNPSIPADLGAIVMKCLRRAPGERFATVTELSAALAPFAGELPIAMSDPVVSKPRLDPVMDTTVAVDRPAGSTQRAWNTQDDKGPRSRVWAWVAGGVVALGIGGASVFALTRKTTPVVVERPEATYTAPASTTAPIVGVTSAAPSATPASSPAPTPTQTQGTHVPVVRPKPTAPASSRDIFSRH